MENFVPPEKTREFIGYTEGTSVKRYWEVSAEIVPSDIRLEVAGFVKGNSFGHFSKRPPVYLVMSMVGMLYEPLRNGICHGGKGKVDLGVFIGEQGVCCGHRDGGEYFKNPEIKRIWEASIPVPSTTAEKFDVGNYSSCGGCGNDMIYKLSHLLEVDCEKGILFCSKLFGTWDEYR